MITKRTQKGRLPDGGKMRSYAESTKRDRKNRGRQTGFVDLTDTGKMFRSLDYRKKGFSKNDIIKKFYIKNDAHFNRNGNQIIADEFLNSFF